MSGEVKRLINNRVDCPFYKNQLLNLSVGNCPYCGKAIYQKEDYIKLDNTYIHFDCWWGLKTFKVNAEYAGDFSC